MANSNNSPNIRPADTEYQAEATVTAWIEGEAHPPATLAEIVQHYRDIVVYMDDPNTSVQDANQALDTASSLFDRLKAAAAQQAQVHSQIQAQLRRAKRKEEAKFQEELNRMSFQERCNWAIARWNAGVRV